MPLKAHYSVRKATSLVYLRLIPVMKVEVEASPLHEGDTAHFEQPFVSGRPNT